MELFTMQLGELATNCYLLTKDGRAAVIDPGGDGPYILRWLDERGLRLEAVYLTHGHFDHVGGVHDLYLKTGCRVYLNTLDESLPAELTAGPLIWTDKYADGDTVQILDAPFQVLGTPGHTPGSVCLLGEGMLFSGDTLFEGSCGRTDFPGGSVAQMNASLRRLAALPGDWRVLPGHGGETTLTRERADNFFMRNAVRTC